MTETRQLTDREFLLETERLGRLGYNQDQIAAALGLKSHQWRYRVQSLGYKPSAETTIRCLRTGRSLEELIESGDPIVPDEGVEVAA